MDEIPGLISLESNAQTTSISAVTKQERDQIDQDVTFALDEVKKKREGQKEEYYAPKKVRRRAVMQHYKSRVM